MEFSESGDRCQAIRHRAGPCRVIHIGGATEKGARGPSGGHACPDAIGASDAPTEMRDRALNERLRAMFLKDAEGARSGRGWRPRPPTRQAAGAGAVHAKRVHRAFPILASVHRTLIAGRVVS